MGGKKVAKYWHLSTWEITRVVHSVHYVHCSHGFCACFVHGSEMGTLTGEGLLHTFAAIYLALRRPHSRRCRRSAAWGRGLGCAKGRRRSWHYLLAAAAFRRLLTDPGDYQIYRASLGISFSARFRLLPLRRASVPNCSMHMLDLPAIAVYSQRRRIAVTRVLSDGFGGTYAFFPTIRNTTTGFTD